MRLGRHREALAASARDADQVIWYQPPGLEWSLDAVVAESPVPARVETDLDALVASVAAQPGPLNVVVMSNGGFGGVHEKLLAALRQRPRQGSGTND